MNCFRDCSSYKSKRKTRTTKISDADISPNRIRTCDHRAASNINPLLCSKCRVLFDETSEFNDKEWKYKDHQSLAVSRASAANGCPLCTLLVHSLRQTDYRRLDEYPELAQKLVHLCIYKYSGQADRIRLRLCSTLSLLAEENPLLTGLSPVARLRLTDFGQLEIAFKEDGPPVQRVSASNTGDYECIQLIRYWKKQCNESHATCIKAIHRASSHLFWPSRLLEVHRGDKDILLALRDSSIFTEQENYLTLSHCWGDGLPYKLCRETAAKLEAGIVIGELPQTFQDAARLALQLSIKYIWIDALCILQDSAQDWEKEAARMCDVYSNSLLNIMAAASPNSNGGLFFSRNPLAVTACEIRASWNGLRAGDLICYDTSWSSDRVLATILQTRAWVVQERLLSTRNVHFTRDQIIWECRTHVASETFPQGIPDDGQFYKSWETLGVGIPSNRGRGNVPLLHWSKVVETYTSCGLTKTSDKLVALSGLARDLDNLSKSNDEYDDLGGYLAGLWRNKLCHQLLWRTPREMTAVRSSYYRAPSWSWASIDGVIEPNYTDTIDEKSDLWAQVYDASTMRPGDVYGSVNGGWILIAGLLCETFFSGSFVPIEQRRPREATSLHKNFEGTLQLGGTEPLSNHSNGPSYFKLTWDDPKNEDLQPLPIYFLALRYFYGGGNTLAENYRHMEGLLLRPTGGERGQHRRVGTLSLSLPEHISRFFTASQEEIIENLFIESVAGEEEGNAYMIEII